MIHNQKINLLVFLLALTFWLLPLHTKIIISQFLPPATWNGLALIYLIFLNLFFIRGLAKSGKNEKIISLYLPLAFLIILFLTFIFSGPEITSANGYVPLLIGVVLIPLLSSLKKYRASTDFVFVLLAVISLHAQWGIAQFILQRDIGFQLLGESNVSAAADGVAKFSAFNQKLVRPYGPYPHANDYAGSLLMGLILTVFLVGHSDTFAKNNGTPDYRDNHKRTMFILSIAVTLVLGLILSFSRSAYVGLLILGFTTLYRYRLRAEREIFINAFLLMVVTVISTAPLMAYRLADSEDVAAVERFSGVKWALDIIRQQSLIRGAGAGGYVPRLQMYLDQNDIQYEAWELQPVHSVPLQMMAELGVLPAAAIIGVIAFLFWQKNSFILLLPTLPLLLLDHYIYSHAAALIWFILLCILAAGGLGHLYDHRERYRIAHKQSDSVV